MLNGSQFHDWCLKLQLRESTREQIQQVRSSPPSRRVQSRRGNVSGRYPSQKMGVIIQFESHHHELAGIYLMEYDSEVLEYYDQPPAIKLSYESASGRQMGVRHTPDFFVIRQERAGWEEWKTTQELTQLAVKMPNRYQQVEPNQWRCPPGEDYARARGFYYLIRTETEIEWYLQRNLYFLEDYFRASTESDSPISNQEKIMGLVATQPAITLLKLLELQFNPDEIYSLIATKKLYVDLSAADLASEAEKVQLFLSIETARSIPQLIKSENFEDTKNQIFVNPTIGSQIIWDGIDWRVLNLGSTEVTLLNSSQNLINLSITVFDELISSGKITVISNKTQNQSKIYSEIIDASESDCAEANRRYQIVAPYLIGSSPRNKNVPRSSFYRWIQSWREAEQTKGYGYFGLLPRNSKKGNRQSKFPALTQKLMDEYIAKDYETYKQKGKRSVYGALVNACEQQNTTVPSYKTFLKFCNSRPSYEQIKKRQGSRAAYQNEPFYWELEFTTPRHGDRPWAICHLDHTQLDIELVSSKTQAILGRPWVTFLSDAYSRRILALYLTFDPPSYRSCMMVMRDCVGRYGRFPQCLVVDGGKEFSSIYFERLLAMYECTSKTRPGGKPRFGSVCERLFGTANTMFIHNLAGNTQITKNSRQVTTAVNPRRHAVWTLGSLYQYLCNWVYEFYDHQEHPALGQSPANAYHQGIAQTGLRPNRLIPYDETFCILTLPTTPKGTAKVIPNQGVKINHLYYWHQSFRNGSIEKTRVNVRYDPSDAGVAYAYVRRQWVRCISQYYSIFHGRSEREIQLATQELRQQHKQHSQKFTITAKALANFLEGTQATESILLQRLKDGEAKDILSAISSNEEMESKSPQKATSVISESEPLQSQKPIEIKPYEEFW